MSEALRAIYGGLIRIPVVGPLFRIPVLTVRAFRQSYAQGSEAGGTSAGLSPAEDAARVPIELDILDLTVHALDGLRDEVVAQRDAALAQATRIDVLEARLAAMEEAVRALGAAKPASDR